MTDLLSRLQSATGPSRELDAEIALANGWECKEYKGKLYWRKVGNLVWSTQPPRYTASIDAVLTLMPKEHELLIELFNGKYLAGCDRITRYEDRISGATPAIALLIAIMKAKTNE